MYISIDIPGYTYTSNKYSQLINPNMLFMYYVQYDNKLGHIIISFLAQVAHASSARQGQPCPNSAHPVQHSLNLLNSIQTLKTHH